MKKIIVLMGGNSTEREVSLNSGNKVFQALQVSNWVKEKNISVETYDLTADIYKFCTFLHENKDIIIFNALHGATGEDGKIQSLLDLFSIPYTHSGVLACAVGINKLISKEIAKRCNMFVAKDLLINTNNFNINEVNLPYPLVLKPINEGSSTNIYIVKNQAELTEAVNKVLHLPQVMLEEYIEGKECTVGILDGVAIGVTEIETNNIFYDYDAKYTNNKSTHLLPPKNISNEAIEKMKYFATKIYKLLAMNGTARVDFIVNSNMVPYFLEINTHPGLTNTSLLPEQAASININYEELCLRLLASAKHNL